MSVELVFLLIPMAGFVAAFVLIAALVRRRR
jgi:hypothetical protein